MFPFYSNYSVLLQRQREEEERRRRQEQAQRRSRFLVPGTWGGEEIPDDTARLARGRALLAFGGSMLGLEAAKDPGAALGRGVAGFSDAMSGTLEEQRQIARQREQDRMEREAAERAGKESDLRIRSGEQSYRITDEEQARKNAENEATAARVRAIAQQVESTLPDSPEAQKARALAEGPNAYLFEDEINTLQEKALQRARRDEDAAWETGQDIRDVRAKVSAGVEEDPLAAGRRAERGLALEAQRNAAYLESIRERGTGTPTAGQFADDVRAEAKTIYDRRVDALEAAAKSRIQMPVRQPDGSFSTPPAFTQADLDRIANEARAEAESIVRGRYGADRGGATSPAGAIATPDEVERRLGRSLTSDERAEVEAAIRMGYTLDRILGAL